MICTSSLAGIIKVFEGGLLTESEIFFCPLDELPFVKRAIFKIIPENANQVKIKQGKGLSTYPVVTYMKYNIY